MTTLSTNDRLNHWLHPIVAIPYSLDSLLRKMKSCSTNDRLVNWLYVTHALPCCSGQVQKVNSSCACATFIGLRKETVSHLANDELNHRFRTLQDTVFTLTKRHERKMTSFYATKIYHGCSLVLLVDMKIKPFLVNGWIDPLFLCGFVNVFFFKKNDVILSRKSWWTVLLIVSWRWMKKKRRKTKRNRHRVSYVWAWSRRSGCRAAARRGGRWWRDCPRRRWPSASPGAACDGGRRGSDSRTGRRVSPARPRSILPSDPHWLLHDFHSFSQLAFADRRLVRSIIVLNLALSNFK